MQDVSLEELYFLLELEFVVAVVDFLLDEGNRLASAVFEGLDLLKLIYFPNLSRLGVVFGSERQVLLLEESSQFFDGVLVEVQLTLALLGEYLDFSAQGIHHVLDLADFLKNLLQFPLVGELEVLLPLVQVEEVDQTLVQRVLEEESVELLEVDQGAFGLEKELEKQITDFSREFLVILVENLIHPSEIIEREGCLSRLANQVEEKPMFVFIFSSRNQQEELHELDEVNGKPLLSQVLEKEGNSLVVDLDLFRKRLYS